MMINREIRQVCQQSPLLFNIALETLAIAIQTNREIEEIKIKNTEAKIELNACDSLLFEECCIISKSCG